MLNKINLMRVFFSGISRTLSSIIIIVLNFYLINTKGIDTAGMFIYLFSVIMFFSAISRRGFDLIILKNSALNRYIRYKKTKLSPLQYSKRKIMLSTCLCIFFAIVLILSSFDQIDKNIFFKVVLICFSIFFINRVHFFGYYLQGISKSELGIFIINGLYPFIIFLLTIISNNFLEDENVILLLFFSSLISFLFIYVINYFYKNEILYSKLDEISSKSVKISSRIYFYSKISNTIILWGPSIVAGYMFSNELVNIISISQRIGMAISMPLTVIATVLMPKISKAYVRSDFDGLRKTFWGAYNLIILVTFILVLIIIALFQHTDIFDIFQKDYDAINAVKVFYTFILAYIIFNLRGLSGNFLDMTNHEDKNMITGLVQCLSFVIFNYFLFYIGIYSIPISVLIAFVTGNFCVFLFLLSKHNYIFFQKNKYG